VETRRGCVTVRGFADSGAHRDAALYIVRAVPGVRDVVDDTSIPAGAGALTGQP
jgi:osmotically-inducible protein OsmY